MTAPTLRLGRDGMGSNATEEDFEAWVDIVTDRIDAKCEFQVDVEVQRASDVQEDRIYASDDCTLRTIREAKADLWDEFCAGSRA